MEWLTWIPINKEGNIINANQRGFMGRDPFKLTCYLLLSRLQDWVIKLTKLMEKQNFDFFKAPNLWQQKDGNAVWHVPNIQLIALHHHHAAPGGAQGAPQVADSAPCSAQHPPQMGFAPCVLAPLPFAHPLPSVGFPWSYFHLQPFPTPAWLVHWVNIQGGNFYESIFLLAEKCHMVL